MILGKSVVSLLLLAFVALCLFFVAQWLIPLLFGLIGFGIPPHIVNVFAILIAVGVFYGGWVRVP